MGARINVNGCLYLGYSTSDVVPNTTVNHSTIYIYYVDIKTWNFMRATAYAILK